MLTITETGNGSRRNGEGEVVFKGSGGPVESGSWFVHVEQRSIQLRVFIQREVMRHSNRRCYLVLPDYRPVVQRSICPRQSLLFFTEEAQSFCVEENTHLPIQPVKQGRRVG